MSPKHIIPLFTIIIILSIGSHGLGQSTFLTPSNTFVQQRYQLGLGGSILTYSAFTIGLNSLWYKDYPRSHFHLFNDWNEWENMDKAGHIYNAYFQSHLIYQGARWTGLDKTKSIWYGIGVAMLFQSTIEVLDGFSEQWGFSIPDMASNIVGVTLFGLQQHFWNDQRIKIKFSAIPVDYSNNIIYGNNGSTTTYKTRAEDLFTSSLTSSILKDYNAQIIWLSVSPASFIHGKTHWPNWLNLAVGYGAQNMYGGFNNTWEEGENSFELNIKRQKQYYLSLDIDLDRINTKNAFLKSVLSILNIVKIPMPAFEYNSEAGFKGHWLR